MKQLTRREYLVGCTAGLAAMRLKLRNGQAQPTEPGRGCTLSIGTYSLKGIPLEKAIRVVAEIGYDGIEIATQPGLDGQPSLLSATQRTAIRSSLKDEGLVLTALMENLYPSVESAQHERDLARLRQVVQLSTELAPDEPPLIQTVLGGGTWEQKKLLFRDRLGDWFRVANEAKVTLAIKPHRGGAMSRPAEAIWLIQQLGNPPRLRMVYDYSHYAFRQMPLEETIRESLPVTAHIAVKDAVQQDGKVAFVLPGQSGSVDYARLLKQFHEGGYRGDICCEVSSMVFSQPGYDAQAAAKTCYQYMAAAFDKSGVPRYAR